MNSKRIFFISFPVLLLSAVLLQSGIDSIAQPLVTEDSRAREIVDATGFKGAVLIYAANEQTYVSGHGELVEQSWLPASTFKIFSALVALETGVIAGTESTIKWDGVIRGRTETNTDLDLQSAFRISAVPHFQYLVRQIGEERMQHYIDAVAYGNKDISGGADTFWLTGNLRISPLQQIEFLQRLYNNDLPFSSATLSAVRAMMVSETSREYTIRAKTGWATVGDDNTGWWVGWVEQGAGVYFFASLLSATSPGSTFGPARLSIARDALGLLSVGKP